MTRCDGIRLKNPVDRLQTAAYHFNNDGEEQIGKVLDSDVVLSRLSSQNESFLSVSSDPFAGWEACLVRGGYLWSLLSDLSSLR